MFIVTRLAKSAQNGGSGVCARALFSAEDESTFGTALSISRSRTVCEILGQNKVQCVCSQ